MIPEITIFEFNLAPVNPRRDIAMLGLIHSWIDGFGPSQSRKHLRHVDGSRNVRVPLDIVGMTAFLVEQGGECDFGLFTIKFNVKKKTLQAHFAFEQTETAGKMLIMTKDMEATKKQENAAKKQRMQLRRIWGGGKGLGTVATVGGKDRGVEATKSVLGLGRDGAKTKDMTSRSRTRRTSKKKRNERRTRETCPHRRDCQARSRNQ